MYYNKNQLSELPFCGPHPKPRGDRGLSKNYNLCFYPKLGHGMCAICRIPCNYFECTSMLDQPWIYGTPSKKEAHYQPVTNFTYWPVLGSCNNWNIIHL